MNVGLGEGLCLIDNSAFQRVTLPAVAAVWTEGIENGRIGACGPLVAEALYSTQTQEQAAARAEELTEGLPYFEIDESAWRLAFKAQVELAGVAERFHRRPPVDYLVAACAHRHGLGVLHYDRDYDLIAEHSSLAFDSRWVVEPGTL